MQNDILNLGILAHVDAGKTTLTEQMLLTSGKLRIAGSVDKGTSITDSLAIERERGISVRASTASFQWKGVKVNIIDTPGHIDFCGEVERTLPALDAAILVISAVERVQGHTVTLFNALKALSIPTLIFINKIDRVGADIEILLSEIECELSNRAVYLQKVLFQGSDAAEISSIWNEQFQQESDEKEVKQENYDRLVELIVEQDDDLLNSFIEGVTLNYSTLNKQLIKSVKTCDLYPIVCGSAKNSLGISQLLDAIIQYLPKANNRTSNEVSAIVFKIEFDESLGKLVHLRVYSGSINPKDLVVNTRLKTKEKVSFLRQLENGKLTSVKQLLAGDIGIVSGFNTASIGDVYGSKQNRNNLVSFSTPLLTVQVKPKQLKDYSSLVTAMKQLSEEDPSLNLNWLPVIQELHLNITGKIQIEILQALLKEQFDVAAEFSSPSIIYKETPSSSGFGFERYWMPKPCWAILKLKIEPAERGSGVKYLSKLGVNSIAAKYQNEIEHTIEQALKQGLKGWQVTDVLITLVDGEDHNVHTRSGDYTIATPMAIMNGLAETGTTLLEPILSFTIVATNELLGAITSDITKMRGEFLAPEMSNNHFVLKGKLPASTSLEYPIVLASLSGGKAKLTTKIFGYEACDLEHGKVTPFRGVNPLERDKWILQARGALK
jgi:ribosomal protection tetracycline resistance protein